MYKIVFLFSLLPIILCAQDYNPQVGQDYKVVSIYFGGGSSYIDEDNQQRVREFLNNEILENYEIHIHSHTDNVGGVEFNERLSRSRSEAAHRFLQEENFPIHKVYIEDHGLFDAQFDNDSWDGRAKNRRVDIVLWPLSA